MPRRSLWLACPCLVTLLASAPLHLGAQSVSPGVMAGGSLSTFTGDIAGDVKNYAGFIAGAFVHLEFAGFAVQPGVYYTTKGVKSDDFEGSAGSGHQSLDYIQVPLVVRIHLGPLYVGGGPAIGVKVGCKITFDDATSDCSDAGATKPATTEVSGIGEAGLRFGKFSLGLRADLGLTDLFNGQSINNVTVHTRTVSAIIEIRL
jgi:outer membrane protein with beta-barrel domain